MDLFDLNNTWRNQNILTIKSFGFQICMSSDSLFLFLASLYVSHSVDMCLTDNMCFFFCFRFIRIFGFCIILSKSFSLKALVIKHASKCPGLFSYIFLKVMISYPSMSIVFALFILNGLAKSGMSFQG